MRLWESEVAMINVRFHMHLSLGSISLKVGPLCSGLTSAWLRLAGSRQSHNVVLGLETSTNYCIILPFNLFIMALFFVVFVIHLIPS